MYDMPKGCDNDMICVPLIWYSYCQNFGLKCHVRGHVLKRKDTSHSGYDIG